MFRGASRPHALSNTMRRNFPHHLNVNVMEINKVYASSGKYENNIPTTFEMALHVHCGHDKHRHTIKITVVSEHSMQFHQRHWTPCNGDEFVLVNLSLEWKWNPHASTARCGFAIPPHAQMPAIKTLWPKSLLQRQQKYNNNI